MAEEWKDAETEKPKLVYKESYYEPDDPDHFICRWSKDYLVIAEDEDGLRHEMKAHYRFDEPGGESWEYYDRTYGYQIFVDNGLKAIKWKNIPKKAMKG